MKQLNLFSKHKPINEIKPIKVPSIQKIYLSPEPESIDDFLSNVKKYALDKNVVIEITSKQISSDATQIKYNFEYSFIFKEEFYYPSNTIYKHLIKYVQRGIPLEHNESVGDYLTRELYSLEYRLNKKGYTTNINDSKLIVSSLMEETKKKLIS